MEKVNDCICIQYVFLICNHFLFSRRNNRLEINIIELREDNLSGECKLGMLTFYKRFIVI